MQSSNYPVWRYRDLMMTEVPGGTIIVSCDSCGGTGDKPADCFPASPETVGRFVARVALLEVISLGAEVLTVTNSICDEMNPTGKGIIAGIMKEMEAAGVSTECLTGSTEENFETAMTAVGTSVVGYCDGGFIDPDVRAGDALFCVGEPCVGAAVQEKDAATHIASYWDIKSVASDPRVREVVPVGSKGVAYEANTVAELHSLSCKLLPSTGIDYTQSGGPSTCAVVVVDPDAVSYFTGRPKFTLIGWLYYQNEEL